jgi:hypothetical protein
MKSLLRFGSVVADLVSTISVFADLIAPTSFSDTIAVGGKTSVHKTVTVEAGRPVSSKVDVFFLAAMLVLDGGPDLAVDRLNGALGSFEHESLSVNDSWDALSPESLPARRAAQDSSPSTAKLRNAAGGLSGDNPEGRTNH